ncbi:MAG: hypothetical protein COU29_03165 [Candidatus Magasanikbacteria bacterium CG10_big_fil_rev_8_21_14_0_10_36_32]|uniref:Peptidase M14 domain-containing protein n=1 Tax=Candidatus Magasanikbacteria bacterium CG10_big_fil_rev_8_21_14_0_10_36_32 TaxID=1974646 RepID=A0A2M6W632_9BACT|nr:MAG: hypothetical protein COU29_03165 [Candidatus Magasanikbacteria bacterium CG10_big_fil_rev_8_21_14_0_10_36_32]
MNVRSYQIEVLNRLEPLKLKGFKVVSMGNVAFGTTKYPMRCVIAQGKIPAAHNVFISAGIHGDEPAGVYATLSFLENKIHDYLPYFNFVICPCLNPGGFEDNTMDNPQGINLNRNFLAANPAQEVELIKKFLMEHIRQYLFAIDMHEDDSYRPVDGFTVADSPREFYLYEVTPDKKLRLGHKILKRLENNGITVCKKKKIYYEINEEGLVWSPGLITDPNYIDKETLDGHLQRYTSHAMVTETPTCWSFDHRVQTQMAALESIMEEFKIRIKPTVLA